MTINYSTNDKVTRFEDHLQYELTAQSLGNSPQRIEVQGDNLTAVSTADEVFYPEGDRFIFERNRSQRFIAHRFRGREQPPYIFLNSTNISTANLTDFIENRTGQKVEFGGVPVVVLSYDEYEERFDSWSGGRVDQGVIYLKDEGSSLEPRLVHETVHVLNRKELPWDSFRSNLIDEGLATYLGHEYREQMASEREGMRIAPGLFGQQRTFIRNNSVYEVQTRGSLEELEGAIKNRTEFYRDWHSYSSDRKEFGYAYAELVVKNLDESENSTLGQLEVGGSEVGGMFLEQILDLLRQLWVKLVGK